MILHLIMLHLLEITAICAWNPRNIAICASDSPYASLLLICRYKSLYGWHKVLQSSVLCLYLTEAFILFKMCICISCYLFQISVWHGLRFIQGGLHGLFLCMKQLFAQFKEELCYTKKWYSINLGGYSPIRISFMMIILFGISLAYSHLVLFRLFVGLHKINPVFLLISH